MRDAAKVSPDTLRPGTGRGEESFVTRWGRNAAAVVVLAVVLAASGCGSDTPEARPATAQPKVVLIGWDAAKWDVIRPMVEAGQLPNLARLLEEGARGVLRADPPILSPVVWTTIATGFPPSEHGITGFEPVEQRRDVSREPQRGSRACDSAARHEQSRLPQHAPQDGSRNVAPTRSNTSR